jgi:hypothetical protein
MSPILFISPLFLDIHVNVLFRYTTQHPFIYIGDVRFLCIYLTLVLVLIFLIFLYACFVSSGIRFSRISYQKFSWSAHNTKWQQQFSRPAHNDTASFVLRFSAGPSDSQSHSGGCCCNLLRVIRLGGSTHCVHVLSWHHREPWLQPCHICHGFW